jgi:hypothetical protein
MAHGDAWEGTEGATGDEWVSGVPRKTAEHSLARTVQMLTADQHTSAASNRLKCRPRRVTWTRPFHRKAKSGFCACAI